MVKYFELSLAAKVMGQSKKVIGHDESVSVKITMKVNEEKKVFHKPLNRYTMTVFLYK